jgi:hypothetical protein
MQLRSMNKPVVLVAAAAALLALAGCGDNQPLSGAHKYVIRFDKGQTPPANAFWSITQ